MPLQAHLYPGIIVESANYSDWLRLRTRNTGSAALTRVVWGWEFQFRSGAIRFATREDGWAFPAGATAPGLTRDREWYLTLNEKDALVAAKAVVLYAEFENGVAVGSARDRIRSYYAAEDAKLTAFFRDLGGLAAKGESALREALGRGASSQDAPVRAHARHLQILIRQEGAGSVARHVQWFLTFRTRL